MCLMRTDADPRLDTEGWPLGAHLVTPRRGYTHHGIYVGNGRVIHYSGFSRMWWPGPVEQVSIEHFARGRPVAMQVASSSRYDGSARAERARQRLGENCFSLFRNNCEHFCEWCEQGISRSAQIDALRARLNALVAPFTRRLLRSGGYPVSSGDQPG